MARLHGWRKGLVVTTMTELIDETGNVHGRLTVLRRAGSNEVGHATWLCECECGNETVVSGTRLRMGKKKSCGCLAEEIKGCKSRSKPGPKANELKWKSTGDPWLDLAYFIALRTVKDAQDSNVKISGRTRHPMKQAVIEDARKWLASEEGQDFLDSLPGLDDSVTGQDILNQQGICANPHEEMLRARITELIETRMYVTSKGVEGAEEAAQELMECFIEALAGILED